MQHQSLISIVLLKDIIVILCTGGPVQAQVEWSNIVVSHQTRSEDNKVSTVVERPTGLL